MFKPLLAISCLALATSSVSALTLQEAVQHTLESNPEVLAAQNEYRSRSEEVRGAKAGYLPSLDAAAGIGRQTIEAASTSGEKVTLTRHEASLSARQMLFDGFATSSEVDRQEARYSSAFFKAREVEENTALNVSKAYLDLLRYTDLLDLARATLYEHQNIHDQMVLRSKSGVGSNADLNQISARLALAYSNMISAQSNLLDAKTSFQRITGLSADVARVEQVAAAVSLPESLEQAEKLALEAHPTMKSAGADVDSAVAQYDASESGYWPRVQLEADKRWDENIDGVRGDSEDLVVALRLTYNLYNGGADKARRNQTAYLLEEAKDIRGNTQRQVVESLHLSWSAFQTIQNQLKYLEMHVDSATQTKSAYQKQFNIGRRTLLDLLNTENELVDAKRNLINAQYDLIYSLYRIYNSLGQLLEKLGIGRS